MRLRSCDDDDVDDDVAAMNMLKIYSLNFRPDISNAFALIISVYFEFFIKIYFL